MNETLERTQTHARPRGPDEDRGMAGQRSMTVTRLAGSMRSGGRLIRRRGTRSSFPARDRLCERWYR